MQATANDSARRLFGDDALDFVAGADRRRRLVDDDDEVLDRFADLARRLIDVAHVGAAVARHRRRADADEDRLCAADSFANVAGERQPSGAPIGGDELAQARLVDRRLAGLERRDLAFVLVDADDVVTEVGEARP